MPNPLLRSPPAHEELADLTKRAAATTGADDPRIVAMRARARLRSCAVDCVVERVCDLNARDEVACGGDADADHRSLGRMTVDELVLLRALMVDYDRLVVALFAGETPIDVGHLQAWQESNACVPSARRIVTLLVRW